MWRQGWIYPLCTCSYRLAAAHDLQVRMILETLNSLQREPQRADLNTRHKLISHLPHPVFNCHMGACRFISTQSALIVWHNAFNVQFHYCKLDYQLEISTGDLICKIIVNILVDFILVMWYGIAIHCFTHCT